MEEYELTIEYSNKGSKEIKQKNIFINLRDYRESYAEEFIHLQQQYATKTIIQQIEPLKKEFILDLINSTLNTNERLSSNINSLIAEIDSYMDDLDEE